MRKFVVVALFGAIVALWALSDGGGANSRTVGAVEATTTTHYIVEDLSPSAHEEAVIAHRTAVGRRVAAYLQKAKAQHDRKVALAAEQRRATRSNPQQRRIPTYGPWADLINQYPWPTQTAYRILQCESGGNANAYNARSGATGLFQILNGPWDPRANVELAFRMWQKRGFQPWSSSISCWG